MKIIAIIFLISLLGPISISAWSQNPKSYKIVVMTIRYEEMDTETPMRIDCNTFPYYFGNSCKIISIRDSTFLHSFLMQLNSTKESHSNYQPDVRIQIGLFFNDGITRMLCVGGDYKILIYDSKKLEYNSDLIKPILDIISEQKTNK